MRRYALIQNTCFICGNSYSKRVNTCFELSSICYCRLVAGFTPFHSRYFISEMSDLASARNKHSLYFYAIVPGAAQCDWFEICIESDASLHDFIRAVVAEVQDLPPEQSTPELSDDFLKATRVYAGDSFVVGATIDKSMLTARIGQSAWFSRCESDPIQLRLHFHLTSLLRDPSYMWRQQLRDQLRGNITFTSVLRSTTGNAASGYRPGMYDAQLFVSR